MTDRETILSAKDLTPNLEAAVLVLNAEEPTNEALQKALITVRKEVLKAKPTISAQEIVRAVSDLSKLVGGKDMRHSVASSRMRRHLVSRKELKGPE